MYTNNNKRLQFKHSGDTCNDFNKMSHCSPRQVLICSKTTAQILVWVTLFSAIFQTITHFPVTLHINEAYKNYWTKATSKIIPILALIFFPLGGLLGDVYWGRYKMVISGMVMTTISMIMFFLGLIFQMEEQKWNISYYLKIVFILVACVLGGFGFIISSSNIVQFGLDQLMEKPSNSLGVFVHWMAWSIRLGALTVELFFASLYCAQEETGDLVKWGTQALPLLYCTIFIFFILIAYCTRRHFNRDRVKYNPYKMIFKVLNFARKNKYPVGPVSAFAYCDDFRPSRLDYAKERYGGPFTTSDVEDVKAFKNIFLLLLSPLLLFVLIMPTSKLSFQILSSHIGSTILVGKNMTCEQNLDIDSISMFATVTLFPLYTWFIYSVLRNRPPKILHRLTIAMALFIMSGVSLLVIDLTGHVTLYVQNQTQPMCMFVEQRNHQQTLNLHWVVLLVPGVTKVFSNTVIIATGYEFMSAQSPHAMQGVLAGTVYTSQGIVALLSVLLLIPFSLEGIWKDGYLGQHPPVVSCGFGYYLVCITVAMIGFISFIVAVKRYKYRRRDEEPYSQACVEEIFARRIENDRYEYEELSGTNEY